MKVLCVFSFIITITLQGFGQIKSSEYNYDVKKVRLLLKTTGNYIQAASQGTIDIDSAMVLACTANKVPISLAYDEGYNDGSYLPGSKLVDQNNINGALKVLANLEKTDRIKLLLQLGIHYLFKPFEKKEDLQKALQYIKQAMQLSDLLGIPKWQLQSNLLLGKYYAKANNLAASKKTFLQVVTESKKLKDKKAIADALENEGTYLPFSDSDKEKTLSQAAIVYRSINEKEKEAEALMKLINVYFMNGRLDIAEKKCLESIAFQKKMGFKHTHYFATTLSYIYLVKRNNIEKALFYAINSIQTMEATNDMICADNFYLRLGNVYDFMGHYDEAIQTYKKSIDAGTKNINSGSWYTSFITIVKSLYQNKKYKEAINYIKKIADNYPPKNQFDKFNLALIKASAYQKMGNVSAAEKFYLEMEGHSKNLITSETAVTMTSAFSDMSLFYANKGNAYKAKFYADKVLSINKETNQNFNFQELELSLFKIDSLTGNYLSSIVHYQKYNQIKDSIYNTDKNKQIEELKIQYETLQKEQNIKTLKVQTKLQQSKLDKSNLLINLSIWSIILLLIIISLLYNRYQLKQRNNVKLEIKEKEIDQKNSNLQHLLDEKEWLVKEIHHRVKNNLQMVISLLNTQSAYLDDEMALSTIKSSQHRIHAMSLIHQKLYMTENISTINMPIYIKELVQYLKDSFNLRQRIRFQVNVDNLELDVAQAVPLGLIINEAVANCIKYAFPNNQDGIITITLVANAMDFYLLTIQDNGIGIHIQDKKNSNTFGMSLIKGLSDDLDGTFSIENNNGTLLKLSFKKDRLSKKNT
ncbi:histidine kinase dimerization/phosphoacceptor domain -containing protein [Flavobacterium sp. ZT3R17]|uniref:tetratricopeptide repeat-containing sensor histidine kinase n=1 Tax=Flavobacterium cryoconiti TaxID=3398736 RepID=UPI003A842146